VPERLSIPQPVNPGTPGERGSDLQPLVEALATAEPTAEEDAGRPSAAFPREDTGVGQVAPTFSPNWFAPVLLDGSHSPPVSIGSSQGTEISSQSLRLLSSPGAPDALLPPSTLRSPSTGFGTTMPPASRQWGPITENPQRPGNQGSTPGNQGRKVLRIEPLPFPQGAGLLTECVTLDITDPKGSVQALVTPMLEVRGKDPLYWLGVASWLLAAALACEAARRRFRHPLTNLPFLPLLPSNCLPKEHS
jgi:hypothetical protein